MDGGCYFAIGINNYLIDLFVNEVIHFLLNCLRPPLMSAIPFCTDFTLISIMNVFFWNIKKSFYWTNLILHIFYFGNNSLKSIFSFLPKHLWIRLIIERRKLNIHLMFFAMCTVVNRNTIVTVFGCVSGNIARVLSTYRAFEVGVVTEAISWCRSKKQLLLY